jgi:hypothetical protein
LYFAKMASRSKVVCRKNNSPSGFLLRQRHVPVPQVRSLPDSDLPLDSSSDNGDNDYDDDDVDTNTHVLHQHFCSKRGGCEFPFSFDGNEGDSDSGDDDDDKDDNNDNDLENVSKATLSSLASSGDSSSSAPSNVGGNDPNLASCTSNPFQPSSNQNAFGHSDDTDVMLLSCTNNSLQQHISSSDSSSLIGLHHNPECNAIAKLTVTRLAMIQRKLGTIVPVPVPTKVQVLMPAIPVSQCPTRSNQFPGCLSRLVTFHCQKVVQ